MTEIFAGIELLTDDSLPEDCVKFIHGDGRVDVFRIDGRDREQATRMVLSPTGEVFDPDSVAGRFWTESARRKQAREEAARATSTIEYFSAVSKMGWGGLRVDRVFYDEVLDFGPQDLDEWLAEDNPHRLTPYRVPGVLEVLGLA